MGREAVVLDLDSGVYFGLNRTAGALWPALVAGATVPELVQALNADLPAPLAGDRGVAEVSASGETLGDVLGSLEATYPGIGPRVLDDAGKLRRFVNVYVGDDDVRFLSGLETPTPDGTSVSIIPAVAGG